MTETRKSANYYVVLHDGQVVDFENKKLATDFLNDQEDSDNISMVIRGFECEFKKTVSYKLD